MIEWIKSSDELPELYEDVLVFYSDKYVWDYFHTVAYLEKHRKSKYNPNGVRWQVRRGNRCCKLDEIKAWARFDKYVDINQITNITRKMAENLINRMVMGENNDDT